MNATTSRRFLAGLATAAVAAAGIAVAAPAPTAHAVDWTEPHVLTADNSGLWEVSVVSTNSTGGAVAAWIDGDSDPDFPRVRTATAVGGEWGGNAWLSPNAVETDYVRLAANDFGDVAAVWLEKSGDVWNIRAARKLGGGAWVSSSPLSSGAPVSFEEPAIAVGGDGTVHVAYAATIAGKKTLQVRTWKPGQQPTSDSLAADFADEPSLDATSNGDAVVTFTLDQALDSVYAAEYDPGSGWGDPEQVSFIGGTAYQPVAAIADDGRSTLAFTAKVDDAWRIHVVTENALGTSWGLPVAVSSSSEGGYAPALDVDAIGRALLSWRVYIDDQTYAVRWTHRASADNPWPSSTKLPIPGDAGTAPQVAVSNGGRQLLSFVSAGHHYTLGRLAPNQAFTTTDHGPGMDPGRSMAVDIGNEGLGVMIEKFNPTEGFDQVRTQWFDIDGPTTVLNELPAVRVGKLMTLGWQSTDDLSPIATTDVFARTSRWNQAGFTESGTPVIEDATGGSGKFTAQPGRTYCFAAQGTDEADNIGPMSGERCTTLPLDDVSLQGGQAWKRVSGKGHYLSTVTRTKTKGVVLVRKGVRARSLALVVAKSATGGKVVVSFGGEVLKTISLKGTGKRKVVPIAAFDEVRSGKLTIKVVSKTGRLVQVDGLVVAK